MGARHARPNASKKSFDFGPRYKTPPVSRDYFDHWVQNKEKKRKLVLRTSERKLLKPEEQDGGTLAFLPLSSSHLSTVQRSNHSRLSSGPWAHKSQSESKNVIRLEEQVRVCCRNPAGWWRILVPDAAGPAPFPGLPARLKQTADPVIICYAGRCLIKTFRATTNREREL